MDLIIDRAIGVELNLTTIGSAGAFFKFTNVPELTTNGIAYLQGLEAFDNTGLLISPTGKNIITPAGSLSCLVLLYEQDLEKVAYIPLYSLISKNNAGLIRTFQNLKINLVKSGVFLAAVTGLTTAESIYFNFYYKKDGGRS